MLANNSTVRPVSPLKVLSTFAISVALFVTFVWLLTHNTPIYPASASSSQVGPLSKESVFKVNTTGAFAPSRTAYVYTYTQGRWDDAQRAIAIRTSIESLKLTGTERDIVVMVDPKVDSVTRSQFVAHGSIVMEMPVTKGDPITDPTQKRLGVCKNDFAPIHVFSLYDKYDRVVWFDSDMLIILKMDELFLCGEFCSIYMNLNWYTPVVMVAKPDAATHARLLAAASTDNFATRSAGSSYTEAGCEQAWEDFYLEQFKTVEAAPMFHPSRGQRHDKVMRLASGYAVNPIFWYEKYDWHLARTKEYAKMEGTTLAEIPAHGLGFPRFKPWQWIMCIYFNVHALWADWRYALLNEDFTMFIITYSMLISAIVTFTHFLVPILNQLLYKEELKASSSSSIRQGVTSHLVVFLMKLVHRVGWTIPGYIMGTIVSVLCVAFAWAIIPPTTIYFYAWPIFICLSVFINQWVVRFFGLFMCGSIGGQLAPKLVFIDLVNNSKTTTNDSITDHDIDDNIDCSDILNSLPFTKVNAVNIEKTQDIIKAMDSKASVSIHNTVAMVLKVTGFRVYLFSLAYMFIWYYLFQLHIYPEFVLKIMVVLGVLIYWAVLLAAPYSDVCRCVYFSQFGPGVWR